MSAKRKVNPHFHVTVVSDKSRALSKSDTDMDIKAREAVRAAIHRAKVCQKPVAGYDPESKRAYVEYASGEKKYV